MEPREEERFLVVFLVVFLVDFLGERRVVLDARLVDFREVFLEVFLVVRFAMMGAFLWGY